MRKHKAPWLPGLVPAARLSALPTAVSASMLVLLCRRRVQVFDGGQGDGWLVSAICTVPCRCFAVEAVPAHMAAVTKCGDGWLVRGHSRLRHLSAMPGSDACQHVLLRGSSPALPWAAQARQLRSTSSLPTPTATDTLHICPPLTPRASNVQHRRDLRHRPHRRAQPPGPLHSERATVAALLPRCPDAVAAGRMLPAAATMLYPPACPPGLPGRCLPGRCMLPPDGTTWPFPSFPPPLTARWTVKAPRTSWQRHSRRASRSLSTSPPSAATTPCSRSTLSSGCCSGRSRWVWV